MQVAKLCSLPFSHVRSILSMGHKQPARSRQLSNTKALASVRENLLKCFSAKRLPRRFATNISGFFVVHYLALNTY